METATVSTLPDAELKEWVREHEVCGDVTPHFEIHDHLKIQVGYNLTLLAKTSPLCSLDPGCDRCALVFEGLEGIARRVLPEGARVEMEPFDASFHLRPETHWEPEVELVMEVLHREGTFEPPDELEREYPAQIRRQLDALGVEARAWKTRRGPTRGA